MMIFNPLNYLDIIFGMDIASLWGCLKRLIDWRFVVKTKTEKEESRRKFIKTAGKAAVVAPAALLIMNAAEADFYCKIGSSGVDQDEECD